MSNPRRTQDRRACLRVGALTTVVSILMAVPSELPKGAALPRVDIRLFDVGSGSMEPTLLPGDQVVANAASVPDRGHVVAYLLPDRSVRFIKRIVGLPGDRIQMIGGILHINGEAVKRERVDDDRATGSDGRSLAGKVFRETLPNGVRFVTLDLVANGFLDNTPVHTVPAGHYFMLGDNRDNSADSRLLSTHGYVPAANIIGRVELIYFSVADGASLWFVWRLPWAVRWNRVLSWVR